MSQDQRPNLLPGANLRRWPRSLLLFAIGLACAGAVLMLQMTGSLAQSSDAVRSQEDAVIQQYRLPEAQPQTPVVRPQPRPQPAAPARSRPTSPAPQPAPSDRTSTSSAPAVATPNPDPEPSSNPQNSTQQYVLQFNRAPVVGNALQMDGILSQKRLVFSKPRHWQVESGKVLIRFRQSPALYADRSNLTVLLNNRHLGSIPLNRGEDEIGNVLFDVPANLVQDQNTLIMQVQQHTSKDCTDPTDPTLWTEILPDSQVVLNYTSLPIALDFANYPYPFLDDQGLEADHLTYLRPKSVSDVWLTATARFQAAASRLTNARPLQIRVIDQVDQLQNQDRLVVVGTPTEQPILTALSLPFKFLDGKVLDGSGNAFPNGVGVLMLTTTADESTPVLIATGNDQTAVLKAVQALVQPADRQLLTGQAVLVNEVAAVESPAANDWPGYLPANANRLLLRDLEVSPGQLFQDITVNGVPVPPPVEVPLRLVPDEQALRGSTFTLHYSYGPNIDPRRSSVSVMLNGQGIGGERLKNADGDSDSVTVDLPPELLTPTTTLGVQLYTYPRQAMNCGEIPDQTTWGRVHSDSSLNLKHDNVVNLPDLKLLQTGFPLTAPQDMSEMAFVLPTSPSPDDILTMLQVSNRLGRSSRSESIKIDAYGVETLPDSAQQKHLIGIGTREQFPLSEIFQPQRGFSLGDQWSRRRNLTQLQTLPDEAGVILAQVSPWNQNRLLLGLTGQTITGLGEVQQVFAQPALFSRLEGDTVLVQQTRPDPSPYNRGDYDVTTLTQRTPRTIDHSNWINRAMAFLQANWFLLPGGIVLLALVLYAVSQLYLNRLSRSEGV
jgi:hypothetical protein